MDAISPEFELTDAELHLYSRQILLDGWDIEAQEKLKFSNVCMWDVVELVVPWQNF